MNKKAQGLSVNVIIIAVLALLVLVVLAFIFTGKIASFEDDEILYDECNMHLDFRNLDGSVITEEQINNSHSQGIKMKLNFQICCNKSINQNNATYMCWDWIPLEYKDENSIEDEFQAETEVGLSSQVFFAGDGCVYPSNKVTVCWDGNPTDNNESSEATT